MGFGKERQKKNRICTQETSYIVTEKVKIIKKRTEKHEHIW